MIVAAAVLVAAPAVAEAGKKTRGSISIYGFEPLTAADTISFGQLKSPKRSCVSGRSFAAGFSFHGKRKVIDSGRTSDDGAISAFSSTLDFPSDFVDTYITVPATKKCAKVTGPLYPPTPSRAAVGPRVPTSSEIEYFGLFGSSSDAVAGGVVASEKAKCIRDRKIELRVGSKTLDSGTTTPTEGTFALHIGGGEIDDSGQAAIVMPRSGDCASSVAVVSLLSG